MRGLGRIAVQQTDNRIAATAACSNAWFTPIGKESNRLEEVQAGLIHSADGVYTEYVDPRREEWRRAATALSLKRWERESGKSRRILIDARRGRRRPHPRHQALLVRIARQCGLL
jgi:hypothetical protein